MNIFSNDGWFARFFSPIGDIIVVNILFLICSIPIFTIGTSLSAMYYALMRNQRTGDTGGIVKLFFKGFKDNFKKSTIAWLLFLFISLMFAWDFYIFGPKGPMSNKPLYYISIVFMVAVSFIAIYLFPVISAFENTLLELVKQSMYLAIKNIIFTFVIFILYTVPVFFLLSSVKVFMVGIFLFIACGFGLIAYVSSFMFVKAFSPYLEEIKKVYTDDDL